MIAHRLSTVQSCDTITVIEHGHIITEGTYADLLGGAGSARWPAPRPSEAQERGDEETCRSAREESDVRKLARRRVPTPPIVFYPCLLDTLETEGVPGSEAFLTAGYCNLTGLARAPRPLARTRYLRSPRLGGGLPKPRWRLVANSPPATGDQLLDGA